MPVELNRAAANAAKEISMQEVEDNANALWKAEAAAAVVKAASSLRYLTSDDVIVLIPDNVRTHELRAMGPVMKNAAREGIIVKSAQPGRNSARRSLHASPRTVWESCLVK